MVTDAVGLVNDTKQVKLPTFDPRDFPAAAQDALRILGGNMEAAQAGCLFAYALARGLHQGVSVVGHADEGGVIRDVMLSGGFTTPYGGVLHNQTASAVLPLMSGNSVRAFAGWVDSIALATAAAVAAADPGTLLEGNWFPTVLSAGELSPDGTPTSADTDAAEQLSNLRQDISRFSQRYVVSLGKLFGVEGTMGDPAKHLTLAAGCLQHSRHLAYSLVSPYFWIEPTSLIPADLVERRGDHFGGASVSTGDTATEPMFEEVRTNSTDHDTVVDVEA